MTMSVKLMVKDDFPPVAVAPCIVRGEPHETITASCHLEALRSFLSRLSSAMGTPANSNDATPQARSGTTS